MGSTVTMTKLNACGFLLAAAVVVTGVTAGAHPWEAVPQSRPPASATPSQVPPGQAMPTQVSPPADYVIGTDDVLIVMFRREKDMSAEVVVRPDGRITLPILNDIQAAGLTPDQLRARVTEEARRIVEDPTVTVMVKQINSRKVFITGQVSRPGAYPFGTRMTVVQLIAVAGGLTEFAKAKDIVIIRDTSGPTGRPGARPTTFRFNYDEVQKLKNMTSNIDLRPGDTVIVP
jgi:polysaccharide export outer membrane protein